MPHCYIPPATQQEAPLGLPKWKRPQDQGPPPSRINTDSICPLTSSGQETTPVRFHGSSSRFCSSTTSGTGFYFGTPHTTTLIQLMDMGLFGQGLYQKEEIRLGQQRKYYSTDSLIKEASASSSYLQEGAFKVFRLKHMRKIVLK